MGVEIAFWSMGLLLFYVFLGYPAIVVWLARLVTKKSTAAEPADWPRVSLVIPARNEEACIADSLRNKLAIQYPRDRFEVVVVSDASTDRTAEIVRTFHDQNVKLVDLPQRRGAGAAIDAGMAAASGEIIVTTDANAEADPMMVKNLVRHFSDPSIGAVSGDKRIRPPQTGATHEQAERTYWNYENRLKEAESRLYGTLLICDNVNFAFRKAIFTDPCPPIIGHDLWLALYISRKGFRLVYDHEAVVYETYLATLEVDFKRKIRVIVGALQALALFPQLVFSWRRPGVSFQLISHKIMRWLAGAVMVCALAANAMLAGRWFYTLLLVGQGVFYSLALIGFLFRGTLAFKPVKIITYFVSVNLASLLAWGQYLGRPANRKPFWEKARG